MTPADRIPIIGFSQEPTAFLAQHYRPALFGVAFGSAVSIMGSIAVSQILLAAGLVLVMLGPRQVDFPPIRLPLALFFTVTVAADLLSGHPLAGLPQIRKLFVFGMIVVVTYAFDNAEQIRSLVIAWTGVGVLAAGVGFAEVLKRHKEALSLKWNTYDYYLDDRIKGFSSHWMTFGAEQMITLLMLFSFLLFACPRPWRVLGWCCAAVLWVSLMLGLTRCIFLLGLPLGMLYLLWSFKPWTVVMIPAIALVSYMSVPFQVRERVKSVITPHGDLDSNAQRSVSRLAGWEMVKAHPWFGVGPEQVRPQFDSYVPKTVHRPLPHGWYGHLHNIYLQYAAERGIAALVFLMWMIGKMVYDITSHLRSGDVTPESRFVLHGTIAVIISVLAEGFFEYNLGDSEVLTMFLVVTTGAYVVMRRDTRKCY